MITLVRGDVLKPQSIQIPSDCDACIYMACNSRWGTLETQSTIDIAVKGTQNTLRQFGSKRRFVYVSSAAAMIFDDDF